MASPAVARPFTLIERISLWLSAFCMIGMVVLILAEVVLRGAFNSTTEHSDELVGYLLVGVSFFSLALCQGTGAFHKVDMVQMRLGPRGKAVSALIFGWSFQRALILAPIVVLVFGAAAGLVVLWAKVAWEGFRDRGSSP